MYEFTPGSPHPIVVNLSRHGSVRAASLLMSATCESAERDRLAQTEACQNVGHYKQKRRHKQQSCSFGARVNARQGNSVTPCNIAFSAIRKCRALILPGTWHFLCRAHSHEGKTGEKFMSMMSEFKSFAMRGNVMDMAVGIVIGAAFGKIVSSFVNDVLMPPLGMLMGGVDFNALSVVLKEAVGEAGAVTLNYGAFIQTIVDFLIIAFAIFMVVKAMNSLKKKEEAAPAAPPKPSAEVELLTEIRDALKK
jgi:large conductance mechanosensitive channel